MWGAQFLIKHGHFKDNKLKKGILIPCESLSRRGMSGGAGASQIVPLKQPREMTEAGPNRSHLDQQSRFLAVDPVLAGDQDQTSFGSFKVSIIASFLYIMHQS